MSKFTGAGRGLFMQPNSTDPEVGRVSSPINKDLSSPGPPKLVSYEEDDATGEDKDSSEHSALPEESTEDSYAGDEITEEATGEIPQSSECEPPPDQNSNMIDDAVESREPEAVDTSEDAQAPPLEDHTSTIVDNDICESEPSASPNLDKAPECDENVPSAVVPLLETEESMITDSDATEEKAEGDNGSNIEGTYMSSDDPALDTSNEGETSEPKSDEDAKDNENESATIESESTETKASAEMPEKPKIQIAANLNSGSPTTMSPTTSPDIPLLPSPMKVPGAGILGPAPNAPLLPRGPPSMFPKALPISIPPPPMDFRLPPPKVVPKTKEELLQMLTEQVGMIQPPDEKGPTDQGRGKTASPDDQNPKQQQPKKQQYPQRQQQQQQPGQQWQNSGRDNNWRQKTDPNMRMPQQGMPNRQPNSAGKKPSPQGGTKPGFSNLTKDEMEKEYQWQKFSVERKIKKILKSMKTSSDEEVIKELLTIIKYNASKLANFPWPKEQYVVLEKLIEHAILNTDNEESLQKRVATIINSLQDMHPQGFKEDLKNAILHEQGEYIQGSSSEFRRNQARSAGHFLGELYNLSRASSTEFKASVQSVVALTLKDWIKAPNVAAISEDTKLLLEVYAQCLEEFLVLTLRDNDEHLKKQVVTLLKEEILSTTRPIEAKTLLVDTLFKLACHRCTAGVPAEGQKNQQSIDNRETKIYSGSSEPSPGKQMFYSPQQPNTQPITPQKPNNQHDVKQSPQQHHQQRKQQQQHPPPLPGSKFTSPPPSGLSQGQGRLPPGQHPMNFPQGGPVNMSTPPPNMNAPPPTMSQSGHNIPRWPAASQGPPPMPSSIPAASTSTGVVLLNQLQQQIQQQQHLGYMNQSLPASMQTPQGPVPIPQAQIPQGGNQRHSHGLGTNIQMLQQGAFPDPQGMPSQQVLGNMVPQAPSIPPSQASSMSSMMQSNSQTNPHIMSGVPGQQMMQSGNIQMMQYSSAGTTPGHPVQSSSQFLRNLPISLAQQMGTSMNYQQQEDFANQMGQMMLSGSDPWHQSGVGVTQAVTAPIFSTAQGVNPSGHRQEMMSAPPSNPVVQSSQEDMSGQPSFAQSAASGRFVQNRIPEAAPKQSFQNSDDAMHGVSQWGVSPQGSAWPDKLPDSNQLPTTSPPSFPSQNQNPNQWSDDGRNVKSPEAASDTPSSQEPSGWGDANQGPQESSQQRLGTDGWGSSNPSPGVGNWGAEPQPTDSWNGHATSFPGHQTGAVQHNSAEHPDIGPRGFQNQPRMPNQVSAQANAVKAPPKDKYVFEESASSVSGYQRPNAYTLPSKHKEGSPAAEGVSYNAMSELGSYGIGPGNSYDSSSYGGAYTAIRDGGGYGDSFPPEGQKVGNFVLLPENTPPQNSASPDHFEISAIRDCFMDEEDTSSYEVNAYQNQMRFRQQHGQPNWSQFETQKEKQVPSVLHGRSPRDTSHRGGHGRGSLLVTNPCTAMPPFPPAHPPGSRQPPIKQKYQPRN